MAEVNGIFSSEESSPINEGIASSSNYPTADAIKKVGSLLTISFGDSRMYI